MAQTAVVCVVALAAALAAMAAHLHDKVTVAIALVVVHVPAGARMCLGAGLAPPLDGPRGSAAVALALALAVALVLIVVVMAMQRVHGRVQALPPPPLLESVQASEPSRSVGVASERRRLLAPAVAAHVVARWWADSCSGRRPA